MQTVFQNVAGVDVHKKELVITTLQENQDGELITTSFSSSTFTDELQHTGRKLLNMGIKHVAMESTGIFWKPIYNVWHNMGLIITLGNAAHMKNVPGRKTDMKDSHWIATLHRNGLIRSSYLPEEEFHDLRALTRHRQNLVDDLSRVKNRILKVLEDGNVKIGSVLSNVFGVAGMSILSAIAEGENDPDRLLALAKTARRKDVLKRALSNCLKERHHFLVKELLIQHFHLAHNIQSVEKNIEQLMHKHADLIARLIEIPGIDKTLAHGIIAEATTNMNTFKDDRIFAAWAGVAPGNNESGGKKKNQKLGMEIQL